MKTLLIALLFYNLPGTTHHYLRSQYIKAVSNEDHAKELIQFCKNQSQADPTFIGYHGASSILLAKHDLNPYNKYKYFKEGRKLLELAIELEPKNIELIYLRYTIQINCPSFLGYHQKITEDKKSLSASLNKNIDPQLKSLIKSILMNE